MEIRKVKEEDIEAIVDIQINGWRKAYKGIVNDEYLDNMDKQEKIKKNRERFNINPCIVAVDNNEIMGFCRYGNVMNPDILPEGYDAEIYALYVKNDKQHQGIGKAMVKYVMNEFKERHNMMIWCLKENYPARKFYEKIGGKIVAEKPIEIGDKKYDEVGFGYELNQEEIIIREYRKEDLWQISDIITKNLVEVNVKDYGEEMMKDHAKMFSKQNISHTFKDREKVFVALKGNMIVGTAGLEAAWSKIPGEYWILTVFIKPENQGQGIGRRLIQQVEEHAKNINAKKLVVPASITGNGFYYKLGYTYKDKKKELNEQKMYIMEKIL